MIKLYEMSTKAGRFIKASYDDEKRLATVTMFMYPKEGVSIEEVFSDCGFTINTETIIERPTLVHLKPKGEAQ